MLGAAFGLGFIIAPVMGGLPQRASASACRSRSPRALSMCNCRYGLFVLPDSLPPERRQPFRWGQGEPGRLADAPRAAQGHGRAARGGRNLFLWQLRHFLRSKSGYKGRGAWTLTGASLHGHR